MITNVRALRPLPRILLMALAIGVILSATTGCVELTRGKRQPVQTAPPGAFPWSNETVEATGTNSAPRSVGNEVQRSVVAKQAAKTAAIANLKEKIMGLSVTSSRSLGSVTSQNLAIKRAIEQYLQAVKVVSEYGCLSPRGAVLCITPACGVAVVLASVAVLPAG